jgi:hypothetical protein
VSRAIDANYWRDVAGAAYDGQPTLSLTLAQAQRLWGIDEALARAVLDSYIETGYLTRSLDGQYRRSDVAIPAAMVFRR